MLSKLTVIAALTSSAACFTFEEKFLNHMSLFGLSYGTKEEYAFRMQQFARNEELVNSINAKQSSYKAGHNQFSTWTEEEFERLLGNKGEETIAEGTPIVEASVDIPDFVDWRQKGAVNPIQNQGQCGSCWTFSSTCSIEGAHWLATGNLIKLAEQ